MPWKAATPMSLRLEFVQLALAQRANIRSLCRRYGVCAMTAYKWELYTILARPTFR